MILPSIVLHKNEKVGTVAAFQDRLETSRSDIKYTKILDNVSHLCTLT